MLDAFADATVEHMMPGRFRLRFRMKRGDVPFFQQVVALLSGHPAVNEIEANPATGSVLVLHSLSDDDLAALARQLGIPVPQQPSGMPPRRDASETGKELISMEAAGLFGLSALQLARRRPFSSASEHLWQALQAWRLNAPVLPGLLVLLAVFQAARGRVLAPASSLFMFGLITDLQRGKDAVIADDIAAVEEELEGGKAGS